ncbi:MAG TPA: YppG family protein [Virgibacillus sp.]|nr:YppG family protein [Virgibacillus sp.]
MYKRPYYYEQQPQPYNPSVNTYSPFYHPAHEQPPNYSSMPYSGPRPPMTPFDQFAKPAQPMNWPMQTQSQANPQMPPSYQQQPPGVLSQFQDSSGQIDINKMISTVGQLANTVQQVSPMIKQLGSFINSYRE